MVSFAHFPANKNFISPMSAPESPFSTMDGNCRGYWAQSVAPTKRKLCQDGTSERPAKRRHYEDRISSRLNGIDLEHDKTPPLDSDDSPDDYNFRIEEIDPEELDYRPQDYGSEDEAWPTVEEPADGQSPQFRGRSSSSLTTDVEDGYMQQSSFDDDDVWDTDVESPRQQPDNGFTVCDSLKNFISAKNAESLIPISKPLTGKELVLWRPVPVVDPENPLATVYPMNNRITEVGDSELGTTASNSSGGVVEFPERGSSTSPTITPSSSGASLTSETTPPTSPRMPVFPQNGQPFETPFCIDEEPMDVDEPMEID